MAPRHFLMTIFTTLTLFHLLRFPHLILENGGGAFLLIFLIVLNGALFPLLITERILDKKLEAIDLKSLIRIKKGGQRSIWSIPLTFVWYGLRLVVLLSFLWFFLYLSGTACLYFFYLLKYWLNLSSQASDLPQMPQLDIGLVGGLIWSALVYVTFVFRKRFFFIWFTRWILPGCFLILLFLFLKIIFSLQNYEALKVLLYPDFASLTARSLLDAIGHGLACLFVGVGLYSHLKTEESKLDSISFFINLIISALFLALIIGVMALPLIHQVSDLPFGASWIFSILPRWLTYTEYGTYYCALFFLGIIILGFFASVLLLDLISQNAKRIYGPIKKPLFLKIFNLIFVVANGAMVFFLQQNLQGWSGQSLLLKLDYILIDLGLPLLAILTIWFVFRYTDKNERSQVFAHQQIFFHSRYFFKFWNWTTLYLIPPLFLGAFLLAYL